MPELRISTAKVEEFIEAAREVAGKVAPTTGDRTTTGDDSKLVSVEDYPGDDARRQEMSDFITAKSKLADYGETITDAVKFRVDYLERVRRCTHRHA